MLAPLVVGDLEHLEAEEGRQRRELLHRLEWAHADGRHAHRSEGADDVEQRVGAVEGGGVAANEDEATAWRPIMLSTKTKPEAAEEEDDEKHAETR